MSSFFFSTIITALTLHHARWKEKQKYKVLAADEGLTSTELEDLVREAVTEAMLPIYNRLDAMPELPAPQDTLDLSDVEEDLDLLPEEARKTVGRTQA